MQGGAEERDGKLYFNGTVKSDDEKNQIWNALKTVPDWQKDVVADIKVKPGGSAAGAHDRIRSRRRPGVDDHLHRAVRRHAQRIAKKFLGNANDYMDIFNANRDQLTDPDKIKPGQVLKIPQHTNT